MEALIHTQMGLVKRQTGNSVNNRQFCLLKKRCRYLSEHTVYFAIETKKKEIIIKSFTE